jgi:sortase A
MSNTSRKGGARVLRVAHYFFLIAGIAGLGYAGYVIADAYTYQRVEQSTFENVSKNNNGRRPASHGIGNILAQAVREGGVIGELEVPRLGMKVIIVQGDTATILRRAVGHLTETALPGETGNVILAGHRDRFFRPLRDIRTGDLILVKTLDGNFQYQVESTAIVPPSDLSVLQPSNVGALTLITCFPFYYVGPAPNRFVVRARQVTDLD